MSTSSRSQGSGGLREESAEPPPRALAVALGVLLLEAAALAATSVWFLVELIRSGASDVPLALFLVVFAAGIAATLVFAARALQAGRRGGRAPAIGWQLLQGATAVTVLQVPDVQTGALWGAWTALAAAVVVVVLALTPRAVRHTAGG